MVNKIMKYGFFFFISVLAFVACQENEISTFDNESSLFFFRDIYNNNSKGTPQLDSTSYSFFLAGSIQVDTVWLAESISWQKSTINYKQTISMLKDCIEIVCFLLCARR